jgi:hypothetical protein
MVQYLFMHAALKASRLQINAYFMKILKKKLNVYYCKLTKRNHFTHYQWHLQSICITKKGQNVQKYPYCDNNEIQILLHIMKNSPLIAHNM